MKIDVINECNALSLGEQTTFGNVVMKLAAAGVERYIFDMVGKQKLSYGLQGETHLSALEFETIAIPQELDIAAMKEVISDIQQGRIKFLTFLRRSMEAGCAHYEVFITGQKAIYFGRNGAQHIEEFPKAP